MPCVCNFFNLESNEGIFSPGFGLQAWPKGADCLVGLMYKTGMLPGIVW